MKKTSQEPRLYKDLAWIFPVFTPLKHYHQETEEFSQIIRENARIPVRTLLHLGCGAGHNDFTFKKHFRVMGVDVSLDMLGLARNLNPEVEYLEGDMRTIRLDRTFEAVISVDSMNYMLTPEDWRSVIANAERHLNPGGVFFFFVEKTKKDFKQNHNSVWTSVEGDLEIVTLENCYDPDPEDTTYETTFVHLIRRKGKLEIQTDSHRCGLFPGRFIEEALKEGGFEVLRLKYKPPSSAVEAYSSGPCRAESYPLFLGLKPLP